MDADQFDSLLRAFTAGSSRRGVLVGLTSGLLAVLPRALSSEDAAAKHKDHHRHRHRHKHRKTHKHQGSPPSPPPPVVCPPVCPVCQTCNVTTGLCEAPASGNGLPGQECGAPQVCCSGVCCDPIHACHRAGTCATCAQVCRAKCTFCATLADGGTACADGHLFSALHDFRRLRPWRTMRDQFHEPKHERDVRALWPSRWQRHLCRDWCLRPGRRCWITSCAAGTQARSAGIWCGTT
jgi:hypothetical protein